ncbi:uncharacterized protein NECHADRAFT_102084 [Fusarium vanettenii 77-13-4]|uniref:NACHT domain-containing protein n=1 Tax=Fusarium vanettenii (strain ATCC MYA-4622 / CBS 123669 / FGSC 9596 / NRRL 45880 / 77-13-4) TaxID=660122 RepID=C7ZIR4_FUSV7|nr:uncharacterized protein NECHADRAFT_102084 [Fusarium vanettenii 77-13-4]EEU36073.1 hypothetical protein NECHADRAFT_102084 [Fusarium vanettenii 77-13-4]
MAANAKDGFTRALDGFRTTLTPQQQKDFSFNTLQDVQARIQSIQARYGPEKKFRNMKRLSKFLDGMKQVEELVTIFLNVHEVVAFVWGPIKFALMIASNRLETLELLLDTYVEIGEVIPSLGQYEQMFKSYPYLREVLERCFHDILEFHKEALDVFSTTGWKRYFDCAWNTFKTRCKPIIDSLKRHRTLLSDEKLTAAVIEVQEGRRETQDFREMVEARFSNISRQLEADLEKRSRKDIEERKDSLLQARRIISSQLSPGNYEDDQRSAFSQFFSSPSGDWVLHEPRFQEWLQSSNGQVLYLHGMPGAGVVNYLQSQKDTLKGPILYFYFKSRQEDKRSMGGMLRALLKQLIHQEDSAADYVRERWSSASESDLTSLPVLQELVQDCLATQQGGTIVLDGLDECQDERSTCQEPRMIIDWLHQNLISEARLHGYPIRVLLSSQHVDFLEKELTEYPSIRLDQNAGHLHNLRAYAKSKASGIQERFFLTDSKRDSITEKVSALSNGFFLYARVVLDNLMEQGSQSELDEELDTQNFPEDLEAAYERVVIRVLHHGSRSKKAAALKILGWMTCAARPLHWREIQSLFCIDPERGECIPGRWRVDSCRDLCSSLVEEDLPDQEKGEVREPVVRLVHNTAGGYLVHTGCINLLDAHASMALFCSQYLASQPFQDGPRAETIQEFAKTGYYGLLDYAVTSWTHHLALVSKDSSSLQADTLSNLTSRITCTLESYEIPYRGSSGDEVTLQSIEEMLKAFLVNGRKCPFESRISTIRNAIESIHLSDLADDARSIFLRLNGASCFKCPKRDCHNFRVGFSSWKNRGDHVKRHERLFRCSDGSCYRAMVGFPSLSDLQSHTRRSHPTPVPSALFSNPRATRPRDIFDACTKGDLEQVRAYVEQGVDANAPSKPRGKWTPFRLAAKHRQHHICQFLIETGAVQALGQDHRSALSCAMGEDDHELVPLIVHAATAETKARFVEGGELSWRIDTFLVGRAVDDGQMLQALLSLCDLIPAESFPDSLRPEKLLYNAIRGSDSVSNFEVILNWATSYGPKLGLIDATPDCHSITEKRYALITKRYEDNDSLLHLASFFGRVSITRHLLHQLRQPDITATNANGNTPLHELARIIWPARVQDMATLLVEADNGATANMENNNGQLPIHIACENRQERTAVVLASHTHDLDSGDSEGNTVLIYAVKTNMTQAVEALLETKRVDVCRLNHNGETASDLALQQKDTAILQLLHAYHHAAVPRKDPTELFGKDPYKYCIRTQQRELLARIEELLGPDMYDAWSRLTSPVPSSITANNVQRFLSSDCFLTVKAFLSSGKLYYPESELGDLWKRVERDEDDELRALVLLQGEFPQDVWKRELPLVKKLLQDGSPDSFLMRLIKIDWYAHQVLISQAEAQECEELLELLPPPQDE